MNSASPNRRTAIVTGAARGIGAAIAGRLARDGYDVVLFDLAIDSCAETASAVEQAGGRALALAVDVADEVAVRRGVSEASLALGPPTVLVNNAGLLRDRTLANMPTTDWDLVLNVNLRSVFLMSREVLPHMRAAGWGRIVNLSSIAALGAPGEANYAAAKAGVQGLTKTMAIELGRYGITANAVAPGFIVTDMTREVASRMNMSMEDLTKEMLKTIHVGRPGSPDDIANAVAFFVDEKSSFVTGQVLYVAGAPRS
jgi:3-oxoacyl-[acyl-carrier protein] reductase